MRTEWLLFRDGKVYQLSDKEFVDKNAQPGEYSYCVATKNWTYWYLSQEMAMHLVKVDEDIVPESFRVQALLLSG